MNNLSVAWIDHHREPRCAPDPKFPSGIDLVLSGPLPWRECTTALPYPAKRCGEYVVKCAECGLSAVVTTAGRADDPRSVRVTCLRDPL
jgi:hypothetical protein